MKNELVRRSGDGGTTWTTVLDVSEGSSSAATGVATDGSGNIWVAGMTRNASGTVRWTVLKNGVLGSMSANNAAFLQTRQLPFGESNPTARGIVADNFGSVFVTGMLTGWMDGANSYSGQRVGVQRLLP